jgi:alkylated DNA repair dioxygenase AlkB
MSERVAYQPSSYQASLFGVGEPACDPNFDGAVRTPLDDQSWIELVPRWLSGPDRVFSELVAGLQWNQRDVVMYDRLLPEPRLTAWWSTSSTAAEALPVLLEARTALAMRYGRPFDSIGFNLYRDGSDSVAWHGDRERFAHEDPIVATVSVGAPRPFQMRPLGGGHSVSWLLGHGDLFVMGGACQHDWQHCVPKVARTTGPRLSIVFRHHLGGEPLKGLRN